MSNQTKLPELPQNLYRMGQVKNPSWIDRLSLKLMNFLTQDKTSGNK